MRSSVKEEHKRDESGRPAGGSTTAWGFQIEWQAGPLAADGVRVEPTGAFVEDVIEAAIGRLRFYQQSAFHCHENAMALLSLEAAAAWLDHRTRSRKARGVEGTYSV